MRRPLVAGNWKMNGSRAQATALVGAILEGIGSGLRAETVICPPFILIPLVAERLAGQSAVALGGQNVGEERAGAFTGEVSASMLQDYGCRYVIVGHSERRTRYGEDDERVACKAARALESSLTPIICVGETLAEREAGATEAVVARQLDAVLDRCTAEGLAGSVIAYEPVWAIGTGRTASPAQAQAVHGFIRARLAERGDAAVAAGTRILYGGSVNAANAAALFGEPDVDGGLIGGASLKADEFLAICRAAGAG